MSTIYVSKTGNDTTGNVANGNPYLTISKAITVASNGDTILVNDGIYTESNVSINKSITLLSNTGMANTIIRPSYVSPKTLINGTIVIEGNTSNVQIGNVNQGFTIYGLDTGARSTPRAAILLGDTVTGNISNVQIKYNNIVAMGEYCLTAGNSTNVFNSIIEYNTMSGKTYLRNPTYQNWSGVYLNTAALVSPSTITNLYESGTISSVNPSNCIISGGSTSTNPNSSYLYIGSTIVVGATPIYADITGYTTTTKRITFSNWRNASNVSVGPPAISSAYYISRKTGTVSNVSNTTAVLSLGSLTTNTYNNYFIKVGNVYGQVSGYAASSRTVTVSKWMDLLYNTANVNPSNGSTYSFVYKIYGSAGFIYNPSNTTVDITRPSANSNIYNGFVITMGNLKGNITSYDASNARITVSAGWTDLNGNSSVLTPTEYSEYSINNEYYGDLSSVTTGTSAQGTNVILSSPNKTDGLYVGQWIQMGAKYGYIRSYTNTTDTINIIGGDSQPINDCPSVPRRALLLGGTNNGFRNMIFRYNTISAKVGDIDDINSTWRTNMVISIDGNITASNSIIHNNKITSELRNGIENIAYGIRCRQNGAKLYNNIFNRSTESGSFTGIPIFLGTLANQTCSAYNNYVKYNCSADQLNATFSISPVTQTINSASNTFNAGILSTTVNGVTDSLAFNVGGYNGFINGIVFSDDSKRLYWYKNSLNQYNPTRVYNTYEDLSYYDSNATINNTDPPANIIVNKDDQLITFGNLSPRRYELNGVINLSANSNSSLSITYFSSDANVVTVEGSNLTIVGAGNSNITASQAGNTYINAAPNVYQIQTITKADQTITFNNLSNIAFSPNAVINLSNIANSTSQLPISYYTSSNLNVVTVSGSNLIIVGAGTSNITASQSGDNNYDAAPNVYQIQTITKADQTITFDSLSHSFTSNTITLVASASSNLDIIYEESSNSNIASINSNQLIFTGFGEVSVTASQSGDNNYNPASEIRKFTRNGITTNYEKPISVLAVANDIIKNSNATLNINITNDVLTSNIGTAYVKDSFYSGTVLRLQVTARDYNGNPIKNFSSENLVLNLDLPHVLANANISLYKLEDDKEEIMIPQPDGYPAPVIYKSGTFWEANLRSLSGFAVLNNKDTNACFNEGTKILCLNKKFEEEYIPIENLRKGDLVKSYKHGYRKIELIGTHHMINNPNKILECMYKMEKTNENGLIEDLIVTGGHSILVDDLGENKDENEKIFKGTQIIDDKYLLLSCVSKDFKKLENNNLYNYYHFVLENSGNNEERYGVWANGILTETPSKNFFISAIDILLKNLTD
jgi:hypothetical protein